MISREISDTSIVVSLFRCYFRWYEHVKQKLTDIYHFSQTCRLIKGFCARVKICFRHSFLGKITETKQTTSAVLDSSRVVKYLINFLKRWKNKLPRYLRSSLAIILAKDTKEEFNFSPMKLISIIVITAITVNVFLSLGL